VRAAYKEALAYCQHFPHSGSDTGLGLLFWGSNGLGKTALAAAVLVELVVNKGLFGRFWDFRSLVKEIGRSYDKSSLTTDMTTLQSAVAVDVLLLDDLASERLPDWAYDTLFEIVDARYRARKATLVTTAYEDVDSEAALKADALRRQEFLIERIGRGVRSRLLEMCVFVPMEGAAERSPRSRNARPSTLAGLRRREKDRP
jgi:DNA replication protein DnaC